jgi:hypothetical protein
MDDTKTVAILSALANGVNPMTGEIIASESPYQHADVVRALYTALERVKGVELPKAKARPARAEGLSNVGKPWSDEEDRRLLAEFDRGRRPNDIAQEFRRTLAGIEARLEKLGRLSAKERTTANRYSREQSQPARSQSGNP